MNDMKKHTALPIERTSVPEDERSIIDDAMEVLREHGHEGHFYHSYYFKDPRPPYFWRLFDKKSDDKFRKLVFEVRLDYGDGVDQPMKPTATIKDVRYDISEITYTYLIIQFYRCKDHAAL